MANIKLNRRDMGDLLKIHFPKYKGRKITLEITENFRISTASLYWSDGGSKSEVVGIRQDGSEFVLSCYRGKLAGTNPITMNHSYINEKIPEDVLIIKHQYAGMSQWVTVYASPNSMWLPKLLPEAK